MSAAVDFSVHPVAEYFPMIDGAEYDAFKQDIADRGLLKPIEIDRDGRLIDGRNRLRACRDLGIEPASVVVDRDDLTSYIISVNLRRRQLNDVQRARIGEKIAQRANGQRGPIKQLGHMAELPDTVETTPEVVPTQEEVAKLLNVSDRQIRRARVVTENGVAELNALVDDGRVPLATAERISRQEPDEQREAVREITAGAKPEKVAPPAQSKPKAAPLPKSVKYGPRRSHQQIFMHLEGSLGGLVTLLSEITVIDTTVTDDDAARIRGGIAKAVKELNRVNNLLKERSK